jgi:tetratricopeptide (TPR) repeat protein
MLKAQKRLSKRELKEDALMTSIANATDFFEKNKQTIGYALIGVVALIAGTWWYTSRQATNNETASAKLGSVFSYVDNNQYQIAIDGVPERKITGLKSIVEEYGGTDAGNMARFYLANAYFQLGKYDDALKHFEDFSAKESYLAVSRLAGIAGCYEAKGDYENAAENYEKASVGYSKDVDAAANMNSAASNFLLAGKKERALELFKKLKKEYPTTQFARDADRYIAQLSA